MPLPGAHTLPPPPPPKNTPSSPNTPLIPFRPSRPPRPIPPFRTFPVARRRPCAPNAPMRRYVAASRRRRFLPPAVPRPFLRRERAPQRRLRVRARASPVRRAASVRSASAVLACPARTATARPARRAPRTPPRPPRGTALRGGRVTQRLEREVPRLRVGGRRDAKREPKELDALRATGRVALRHQRLREQTKHRRRRGRVRVRNVGGRAPPRFIVARLLLRLGENAEILSSSSSSAHPSPSRTPRRSAARSCRRMLRLDELPRAARLRGVLAGRAAHLRRVRRAVARREDAPPRRRSAPRTRGPLRGGVRRFEERTRGIGCVDTRRRYRRGVVSLEAEYLTMEGARARGRRGRRRRGAWGRRAPGKRGAVLRDRRERRVGAFERSVSGRGRNTVVARIPGTRLERRRLERRRPERPGKGEGPPLLRRARRGGPASASAATAPRVPRPPTARVPTVASAQPRR